MRPRDVTAYDPARTRFSGRTVYLNWTEDEFDKSLDALEKVRRCRAKVSKGGAMRKKALWLGVGIFAVAAVVVGIIVIAWRVDRRITLVKDFFTGVCAADCGKVREMMAPAASESFDDPLLVSFAGSLRDFLGDFKGVRDVQMIEKIGDSETPTKVSCLLDFEKASARGTMGVLHGKVLQFSIHSDFIPREWRPVPGDTKLWQDRGLEFLVAYAEGDAEKAYGMMHPDLQSKAPLDRLREDTAAARDKAGKLLSARFLSEEPLDPSGRIVRFRYRLEFENLTKDVHLLFEFVNLKGYLTGLAPMAEGPSSEDG